MVIVYEASVSLCVRPRLSPAALCVGPGAPRRSLCRGLALTRPLRHSPTQRHRKPKQRVLGRDTESAARHRALESASPDPSPPCPQLRSACHPPGPAELPIWWHARAAQDWTCGTQSSLPLMFHPTPYPAPITPPVPRAPQLGSACHPFGRGPADSCATSACHPSDPADPCATHPAPQAPAPAGPPLRSACHPSSPARSIFPGERTPNLTGLGE